MPSDRRRINYRDRIEGRLADREASVQKRLKSIEEMKRTAASARSSRRTAPCAENGSESATTKIGDNQTDRSVFPDERLHVEPTRFRAMATLGDQQETDLPHFLLVLLSAALASRDTAPLCVILPSVQGIAPALSVLASLECLAADWRAACRSFLDQELTPGTRVRALPDGRVYEVGGRTRFQDTEFLTLHFIDKQNRSSNGRISIPIRNALHLEPTLRKRPIAYPSDPLTPARATIIDDLAGVSTCGNTGLIRNRVVLVGSRSEFERALKDTHLHPARKKPTSAGAFERAFPRGGFSASGAPIVNHPPGAGGQPLVALTRDILSLETVSMDRRIRQGSQIVITDRFDLVLRNLDLAGRVGERQRFILLADAGRRQDAIILKRQGWTVWEPSVEELLSPGGPVPSRMMIPGVDRVHRAAAAELHPTVGWMEQKSGALAGARAAIERLGELLTKDAAETDERLQGILDAIRGLFFRAANWLQSPQGSQLDECVALLKQLLNEESYLRRFVGEEAGSLLNRFVKAIDEFVASLASGDPTPKGLSVLDLARNAGHVSKFEQVLVTGSRASREEANTFLQRHNVGIRCGLVRELMESREIHGAVAFSVLRRDAFAELVDPWPAKSLIFAGYDFEIDLYRRRLEQRSRLRESWRLDVEGRTRVTGLSPEVFGHAGQQKQFSVSSQPDGALLDPKLGAFDRVTAQPDWRWSHRINLPRVAPGDVTVEASIVRFVGRSWMAVTEEHRCLTLMETGRRLAGRSEGGGSQIDVIEAADIHPGLRLIVREGGEKDIVRLLAEQRVGAERYAKLKHASSLWRDALRLSGLDAARIARSLENVGVRRHIVTIRAWLTNNQLIGPRSDEDVIAIGDAFPIKGKAETDWRACCSAIGELRGLHLSAGSRLSDILAERCGGMLLEPAETEMAVDLGIGTVWVMEVGEVDPGPVVLSAASANRVQWTDPAWRARLLDRRIRTESV